MRKREKEKSRGKQREMVNLMLARTTPSCFIVTRKV